MIAFYLEGDFVTMSDLIALVVHFSLVSAGTGNIIALRNYWTTQQRTPNSLVFSLSFADTQSQHLFKRNKVLPGNGSFPRYQYVPWHKSKLSLASDTILETVHTFCRNVDQVKDADPSELFESLKTNLTKDVKKFWEELPRTKELLEKEKRVSSLSKYEKDLLCPPGISNFQMTILFHCLALMKLIPRKCYEYAKIAKNHGPHKLLAVLSGTYRQLVDFEDDARLDYTLNTIVEELLDKFGIKYISKTIVENVLCELHKMIDYYSSSGSKMTYEEVAEQLLHNEVFFDLVFDTWANSRPQYPDVHYTDTKLEKLCNLFSYRPTDEQLLIRDSTSAKKARIDIEYEFDKDLDDFKFSCTASYKKKNHSIEFLRSFFE